LAQGPLDQATSTAKRHFSEKPFSEKPFLKKPFLKNVSETRFSEKPFFLENPVPRHPCLGVTTVERLGVVAPVPRPTGVVERLVVMVPEPLVVMTVVRRRVIPKLAPARATRGNAVTRPTVAGLTVQPVDRDGPRMETSSTIAWGLTLVPTEILAAGKAAMAPIAPGLTVLLAEPTAWGRLAVTVTTV